MKQSLKSDISIREKSDKAEEMVRVRVAMATCGIAAGAREVMNTLLRKVEQDSLPVVVTQGGCMGYCYACLLYTSRCV